MTPERWQRINELFHEALARDAHERRPYLIRESHGDATLVEEVSALLASHDSSGGFLEEPAWGIGAHLILEGESLTGKQIGPYRVLDEIGRGGMGVVYAAEDTRLRRQVALKALPPEYTSDPLRRERLTREARAAAALSHPAIATIHALEDIDGSLYLISELVRGQTLRHVLRDGPLPADALMRVLTDVAAGLAAAHDAGIVHRDLKPENVVRRPDGQTKILDFGLARHTVTQAGARGGDSTDLRLTQSGLAMGTPGYMAPEQQLGGVVDARADVYAFGVLGWECATGRLPYGGDIAHIPVPALEPILRCCLQSDPQQRYASGADVLRALESLTHPREIAPPPRADEGLWWWQFHQTSVAVVNVAMPIAAWFLRTRAPRPWGTIVFFAVLALATISVTLRLNLLFTSRVHPAMLVQHRGRVFTAVAVAEALLAMLLLVGAALVAGPHDALAAILVSLAIVTFASLGIIEPATTSAAGVDRR